MSQLATSVTVVQTIAIDCSTAQAFSFMRNVPQWLPWALPEVESVQPLPFGQWLVKMPTGLAKLRARYRADQRSLAYELVNPAVARPVPVPVQLVATPTGCRFAITFTKPAGLPLPTFEAGMLHTTRSLHALRTVLEQA